MKLCSYRISFKNGILSKVEVHSTRLETEWALGVREEEEVTCECDIFTNTML